MNTTWDGLPVASDHPNGVSVVVRRPAPGGGDGLEYLVLHRAVNGFDYEGDWAWTSPSGARLPSEPILPAAMRELAEEAGLSGVDVWAVDLSGRWAVFAAEVDETTTVGLVDPEHDRYEWLSAPHALERIRPGWVAEHQVARTAAVPRCSLRFRAMTRDDFPSLVRWQATPHVAPWWDDEAPDVAGAERHYGPALDGVDPTRMWVVEVDGTPAGFLQDYLIGEHPEYALLTGRPDAVGFDYAIGEPAWVGRGVGTRILWTFLRDVVRPAYPEAVQFHAAPDHRNRASLRALEKLGFRQELWFDEPQRDGTVDTVIGCTLDVRRMFG